MNNGIVVITCIIDIVEEILHFSKGNIRICNPKEKSWQSPNLPSLSCVIYHFRMNVINCEHYADCSFLPLLNPDQPNTSLVWNASMSPGNNCCNLSAVKMFSYITNWSECCPSVLSITQECVVSTFELKYRIGFWPLRPIKFSCM